MNLLTKLIFLLRKPKVIIVTGERRTSTAEAIYEVLKLRFEIEKLVEKTETLDKIISIADFSRNQN